MISIKNLKLKIENSVKGFTLVELMIVVTIIGILAAVSTVAFQGAKRSARDADRKADLEDIRSALEIYRADCGSYPADAGAGALTFGAALTDTCVGTNSTYMSTVPQDALNVQRGYVYKYDQLTTSTYILCAYLENGAGSVPQCGTCGGVNCNYRVANP